MMKKRMIGIAALVNLLLNTGMMPAYPPDESLYEKGNPPVVSRMHITYYNPLRDNQATGGMNCRPPCNRTSFGLLISDFRNPRGEYWLDLDRKTTGAAAIGVSPGSVYYMPDLDFLAIVIDRGGLEKNQLDLLYDDGMRYTGYELPISAPRLDGELLTGYHNAMLAREGWDGPVSSRIPLEVRARIYTLPHPGNQPRTSPGKHYVP